VELHWTAVTKPFSAARGRGRGSALALVK